MLTPIEMAKIAVRALDEKKGRDLSMLATRDITVLADYFVIATATSTTHIKSLADEVEKALKDNGETPLHIEGRHGGGWVLVDFGCVVVHLFLEDVREFYQLERLWSDAKKVEVSEFLETVKD
ncbi:MAG: ribosome silencing factor [Oscillospiraceae bacterium]|nr:ribosome silencing factor [Oscillospiraceae bacterium]